MGLFAIVESNRKVVWLSLHSCVRVPSSSDAIQRPTGGNYFWSICGYDPPHDELCARALGEATDITGIVMDSGDVMDSYTL